jgi:hypothetical protein
MNLYSPLKIGIWDNTVVHGDEYRSLPIPDYGSNYRILGLEMSIRNYS